MKVLTTEATTPNGNTYKVSRVGRVVGTSTFTAFGLHSTIKYLKSDEFKRIITEQGEDATKGLRNVTKCSYVLTATAIIALCGFLAGGIVDFMTNRVSRNRADEAALGTQANQR